MLWYGLTKGILILVGQVLTGSLVMMATLGVNASPLPSCLSWDTRCLPLRIVPLRIYRDGSVLVHLSICTLLQMRESDKRKGSKRKGHMNDDTEAHAMPGNRRPAKQGRR